jgi:four helix bundle protein
MRNFRELKIWQNGIEIAIKTYRVTETFPKEDKFSIVQQMNRAGVSIPSNIAEARNPSNHCRTT